MALPKGGGGSDPFQDFLLDLTWYDMIGSDRKQNIKKQILSRTVSNLFWTFFFIIFPTLRWESPRSTFIPYSEEQTNKIMNTELPSPTYSTSLPSLSLLFHYLAFISIIRCSISLPTPHPKHWHLRTWIHDNLCNTGQYLQLLQCFKVILQITQAFPMQALPVISLATKYIKCSVCWSFWTACWLKDFGTQNFRKEKMLKTIAGSDGSRKRWKGGRRD